HAPQCSLSLSVSTQSVFSSSPQSTRSASQSLVWSSALHWPSMHSSSPAQGVLHAPQCPLSVFRFAQTLLSAPSSSCAKVHNVSSSGQTRSSCSWSTTAESESRQAGDRTAKMLIVRKHRYVAKLKP